MALAAALLNGFKVLWNADKVSGPEMGIAAKNYQNREDDAVHGTPLGHGGQGLCPVSGDLWSAVARLGQELTFFVGHQCGAEGDTGDAGGQGVWYKYHLNCLTSQRRPLLSEPVSSGGSSTLLELCGWYARWERGSLLQSHTGRS